MERLRPPVTLPGRYVSLVPLSGDHRDGLLQANSSPEVGRWLVEPPPVDPTAMDLHLASLLDRQSSGTDLVFTVLDAGTGRPIGSTRFLRIDPANEAVEIGGTWYDPRRWRTPVNTEAKRLLLGYAFEQVGAHRVVLQTDLRNERSQRAIERLGAHRDAVLREDRVTSQGYHRSSVVYSVLAPEWPVVRRRLDGFLERPWTGAPTG